MSSPLLNESSAALLDESGYSLNSEGDLIACDTATITLTGLAATIPKAPFLSCDTAAITLTGIAATISVDTSATALKDDMDNILRDDSDNPLNDDGSSDSVIQANTGTLTLTGHAMTVGVVNIILTAAFDRTTAPDSIDFTLDSTTTGTIYWVVDENATLAPGSIIAGGGLASGSVAITSSVATETLSFNVTTGTKYFHAIVQRTSDGGLSNATDTAIETVSTHDTSTVTLTGNAATIQVSPQILMETAALSLSASTAYGEDGYGQGPYSETTTRIVLGIITTMDAGAITVTGQEMTVQGVNDVTVSMDAGAITLTGNALTFSIDEVVTMDTAAISLTGPAASFLRSLLVSQDLASVTLTGPTMNIIQDADVPMDRAALTIAGPAASISRTYLSRLPVAQITLAGQDLSLNLGGTIAFDAANISLTGNAVSIISGRKVTMNTAGLTLTGRTVTISTGLWTDAADDNDVWTNTSGASGIWTDATDDADTWTDEVA